MNSEQRPQGGSRVWGQQEGWRGAAAGAALLLATWHSTAQGQPCFWVTCWAGPRVPMGTAHSQTQAHLATTGTHKAEYWLSSSGQLHTHLCNHTRAYSRGQGKGVLASGPGLPWLGQVCSCSVTWQGLPSYRERAVWGQLGE